LYLINPLIIEVHPSWPLADLLAWFSVFPESRGGEVLVSRHGVDAPFTTRSVAPQPDSGGENRASRRCACVTFAYQEKDDRAEQKPNGWEGVCEIESNKLNRNDERS